MVKEIKDIPKGAIIKIKLEHAAYLCPYQGRGSGELSLGEASSSPPLYASKQIGEVIGKYFGQPMHPNSNILNGGALEDVILVSPFMDSSVRIRIPLAEIKSYERVGALRELTWKIGDE